MSREIWVIRHSMRLSYESWEDWEKHPRFKENEYDVPISKNGFELAKRGAIELTKKSKALKNKEIKYIYCSPFTRCIQSALEIIKVVKEKFNYDIKLIIVYHLGECVFVPPVITFKGDKIKIHKPPKDDIKKITAIDKKLEPESLKKIHKNYIDKTIGSSTETFSFDDEEYKKMSKAILNIHKKEKGSYIIVGHLDTVKIAYKYFNQKNNSIPNIKNSSQDPIKGGPAGVNTIVGFKETEEDYEMIYKPNNKFK